MDSPPPRRSLSRSRSRSPARTPPSATKPTTRDDSRSPERSPSRQRSRTPLSPRSHSRSRSRSRTPRASRSATPPPRSAKIVIEKLTKNIHAPHLREIFSHYGTIADLKMPLNQPFLTNRGIAYVVYESAADAETAIAHMHEAQLDGACVSVSIVLPRRRFSVSPPPRRAVEGRFGEPRRFREDEGFRGGRGGRGGERGYGGRGPPMGRGGGGGGWRSPPMGRGGRYGGGGPGGRFEDSYRPGSYSRSRSPPPRRRRPSYGSRSPPPPARRRDYSPPRGSGGGGGRSRRSPSYGSARSETRDRSFSRDRDSRRR